MLLEATIIGLWINAAGASIGDKVTPEYGLFSAVVAAAVSLVSVAIEIS